MINRNNYEEFFLLYVDNELSADQRLQVEDFVALHPDLKEELDILVEMKLPSEDIYFDDKNSLLRFTEEKPAGITEENIQYWMLMKTDNELNAADEKMLDEMVKKNPVYQQELSLLQKAKLDAGETIEFAHKESLYRHETRVVRFAWMRMAAAAAVVLLVALTIFFQLNSNKTNLPSVEQAGINKAGNNQPGSSLKNETQQPAATEQSQLATNDNTIDKNNTESTSNSTYSHENNIVPAVNNNKTAVAANNNPGNKNEPAPAVTNNTIIAPQQLASVDNNIAKAEPPVKTDIIETIKAQDAKILAANNTVAKSDNPAVSNQPVVFTPEDEKSSNKKGLRGFFRKVGRTISRTTGLGSDEDKENKILIGGLAIAK